ncbi:MAG: peptidase domain-containing ABC transporter [Candidatus Obscuribacterales bacterium]|nr:peptidase domain-containing ABC transporter [Candidatus Obscuribacterales bacterium]
MDKVEQNLERSFSEFFATVAESGEKVHIALGENIFSQGEILDCVYFLIDGKVRLYEPHDQSDRTIVILDQRYCPFGFKTILSQDTWFSARAMEQSIVSKVALSVFEEELSNKPDFRRVLDAEAQRLRRAAQDASLEPVAEIMLSDSPNDPVTVAKLVQSTDSPEEENFLTLVRRKFKLYPLVLQKSAMDCGVSCLAMVLSYHGARVNQRNLRELIGVSAQGSDLVSLSEAAEKLGFLSRGIKATYLGLLRAKLPLVCYWDNNHFVVLYEIEKNSALIADPANGLVEIRREDFEEHFSLYALELTPSASTKKDTQLSTPWSRYLDLLKPNAKTLVDIALASFAVQLLTLSIPLFTQAVVDQVIVHKSISMLNIILMGMVILIFFQTIISTIRSYLVAFAAVKLDQSLFTQFFRHLLSLPLTFFEEHTTGDVISRLQENRKIQSFISGSAITVITDLIMAGVYLVIVFIYNWTFALFVIAYIIAFTIIVAIVTPWLRTLMQQAFHKQVASNAFSIEAVRGIERIKAGAAENRTRWAWEELFVDALNTRYKATLISRFTQVAADLVHNLGSVLLLCYGAHIAVQGQISIGQLMAMTLIVNRITQPILFLVDMWDELQDIGVSLERIDDVLETPKEESEPEKKLQITITGDIEFVDVTYRYPGNQDDNAVQNLSFRITPGQYVGIVGRSGCGKSTTLKLLQGLYMPVEGRILVDGHDTRNLSLRELRRQIGVVSQQDYLFRGTIFDTIALYNPQATTKMVVDAAKLAGIHDFINTLPKSYQYEVSEAGNNLSGGQRQRLFIARAILHNPKLLLFDEATSFLDNDSERAIQASLRSLRKHRTIVMVAHRLSTVRDADLILVMDRGQIVEQGTHDELLELNGLYNHLWSQAT